MHPEKADVAFGYAVVGKGSVGGSAGVGGVMVTLQGAMFPGWCGVCRRVVRRNPISVY